VREFCERAFLETGIILKWEGEGLEEKGIDKQSGKVLVENDRQHFRPTEVDFLQGDASKARNKLGWQPRLGFYDLVKIMMESDLKEAEHEAMCLKEGFSYNGIRRHNLYPNL